MFTTNIVSFEQLGPGYYESNVKEDAISAKESGFCDFMFALLIPNANPFRKAVYPIRKEFVTRVDPILDGTKN